jgi:hypothetical protein
MKRFFTNIGRFFWSWGFLKFVLGMMALIVLLYLEEDWRGARAWAETKAKWEAKGETFDINRLAPPSVPDDQNLAALPLFKMEPDPEDRGTLAPLALRRALQWDWERSGLPRGGNWEKGKLADTAKNRAIVAAAFTATFKTAPSSRDSLAQFDALCPVISDLRAAASARPYCCFEQSYRYEMPDNLYLNLITAQVKVSQFLTADAVLALDAKRPDVALADIVANCKLMSGIGRQPLLVSGLVTIAMAAINFSAIYQGIVTHAWNDAQLADLQHQLAATDFLADYQRALRGEACLTISSFDRLKPNRTQLVSELHPPKTIPSPPARQGYTPWIWPDGWIDLLKARAVNFDLRAAGLGDTQKRILSPEAVKRFIEDIEAKRSSKFLFTVGSILSGEVVGPVNKAAQQFAIAQVRVDEARIACALERYRLAQGVYPPSLDAMGPHYIDELPHDVINGAPYRYQLRPDGTFLLYSVGWNQTDDGGNFAFKKDSPTVIDYENGDWVWPAPQAAPAK